MFIVLLGFSGSLGTKCVSLNNESCMIRPIFHLNPNELNYYPFMISIDEWSRSCSSLDDLFTKICVRSKIKDINVKAFNISTNYNEAETMIKQISYDCKCKFRRTARNSNKKWNNDKCQCKCKKYCTCKKRYGWNPSRCICKNSKQHLKRIVDDLAISWDDRYILHIYIYIYIYIYML